jgi:hypothetical protein
MEEKNEPRVPAEAVATTKPAPAAPLAEPGSTAEARALATMEESKKSGLPDQSASTEPSRPRLANRPPDLGLLERQLNRLVPGFIGLDERVKMQRGAIDLYVSLQPTDPIESIIARQIVGLNNLSMDCFEQAAQTTKVPVRDVNLRYGIKGAALLADFIKLFESRRSQGPQNVPVRKLKVEEGGQAIVGNVQTGEKRRRQVHSPSLARRSRQAKTKLTFGTT